MITTQEVAIDHPIQPGWLAAGRELPGEEHIAALVERFQDTNVNIEQLTNMLRLASMRSDAYRMTYEATTRGELTRANQDMATYHNVAGRADKVASFIHWFGSVAETCFDRPSVGELAKIGLELGGKRQAGDWECTGPLDTMVRNIPRQLKEEYGTDAIVHNKGRLAARQYTLLPLFEYGAAGRSLKYAIIRRKRGIADIPTTGGPRPRRVELFKKAEALVVIDQMSERDQELIHTAYSDPANDEINSKKNSVVAGVAGRAFERGITEDRGLTKDIVTVSAHYVMLVRQLGGPAIQASQDA